MCLNEDWRYQFTVANDFCLLEGHLDELQKAVKYTIRWSLLTGFTVFSNITILTLFGYRENTYLQRFVKNESIILLEP